MKIEYKAGRNVEFVAESLRILQELPYVGLYAYADAGMDKQPRGDIGAYTIVVAHRGQQVSWEGHKPSCSNFSRTAVFTKEQLSMPEGFSTNDGETLAVVAAANHIHKVYSQYDPAERGLFAAICSDSVVALGRLAAGDFLGGDGAKFVRESLCDASARLRTINGTLRLIHLKGHPSRKAMEDGYILRKDGYKYPVHKWQDYCDRHSKKAILNEIERRVIGE